MPTVLLNESVNKEITVTKLSDRMIP